MTKKEYPCTISDGETMTPAQKVEILDLYKEGKTKREIAGETGRSMDWIENIIDALGGDYAYNEMKKRVSEDEVKKEKKKKKSIKVEEETSKKRRGRPKGSKNKTTNNDKPKTKKGRGRPKGSKNKKKRV